MENNNRFMPQHTGLSDPYVIQVYCLNNSNC